MKQLMDSRLPVRAINFSILRDGRCNIEEEELWLHRRKANDCCRFALLRTREACLFSATPLASRAESQSLKEDRHDSRRPGRAVKIAGTYHSMLL
jgi:hypothetical protein